MPSPTDQIFADGVRAAVIGAADPEATATWLGRFGFTDRRDLSLHPSAAATLYADPGATRIIELAAPGAPRGEIRVVAAAPDAGASGAVPYARGPYALLLYTRDIRDSLATAAADGAEASEVAAYQAGPKLMQEARAVYPDGLIVVFVEVEDRRPSLLDDDPDRQHSEVHSITFCIDDIDATLPLWEAGGLSTLLDLTVANPDVTRFLSLPRPESPIRLAMLSQHNQAPPRVELLTYPKDPGPAAPAGDGPVQVGLRAATVEVADLDDVALPAEAVCADPVATGLADHPRCTRLELGRGTRLELWERA